MLIRLGNKKIVYYYDWKIILTFETMAKISFNVSARTARLIGLENFANAEGAIIELVKNCYDADASIAIILFDYNKDDIANSSITIIDNGSGMTGTIIKDNWMLIGTNNKETSARSTEKRVRSGAKGIGRFALDKLGVETMMTTLVKGEQTGCLWQVNWDDFLMPGVVISDIKASLDEVQVPDYEVLISSYVDNDPRITAVMSEHKFEHGTFIKITNLRDNWPIEDIERLFNNLELLIPPKEQADFGISLFSKQHQSRFGHVPSAYYDDFDYKLTATTSEKDNQLIDITLIRNELQLEQLLAKYPDFFVQKNITKYEINQDTFDRSPFKYQVRLSELIKGYTDTEEGEAQLSKIGAFDFTCYFLKNTIGDDLNENRYPYKPIVSAARKAWLKKFGGIKIFRDGFRVRPYGEYGQDWLHLGERYAQNPQGAGQRLGGYKIRPNQVSGAINISRLTNINLQDKSGREGIQENAVFQVFTLIITNLISLMERDRNVVMYTLSQLYIKKNKEEEAKRLAAQLAAKAIEDAANNGTNIRKVESVTEPEVIQPNEQTQIISDTSESLNQTVLDLAKGFQAQQNEIQEKDDEIRMLRALAGTGLVVASFAHELRNINPLLVTRAQSLEDIMIKKVDPAAFSHLRDYEQPLTMITDIKDQDKLIKHWLEYALSALKKDKRTRTNIDLIDYFYGYESKWKSVLEKRLITMTFQKPAQGRPVLRGFTVDLDTIFNNMLTNSLEAFKRVKKKEARKIYINLFSNDEYISIDFEDTGAGLSKDFNNPDDIFLPFETSKVDKSGQRVGTGIGMYLTKSIVDDYDGTISILRTTPGFKLRINFPLKFKKNGSD